MNIYELYEEQIKKLERDIKNLNIKKVEYEEELDYLKKGQSYLTRMSKMMQNLDVIDKKIDSIRNDDVPYLFSHLNKQRKAYMEQIENVEKLIVFKSTSYNVAYLATVNNCEHNLYLFSGFIQKDEKELLQLKEEYKVIRQVPKSPTAPFLNS